MLCPAIFIYYYSHTKMTRITAVLLFSLFFLCQRSRGQTAMEMSDGIHNCSVPQITIVTIAAYQYVDVFASIPVAIQDAHAMYGGKFHLKHQGYTNKKIIYCEQMADDTVNIAAQNYYENQGAEGTMVIISPFCSAEFLMVAKLTSEWNIPVISTLGSVPDDKDNRKNPTALSVAPAHHNLFVAFVKDFLVYSNWTTIFVVCDDRRDLGYFRAVCESLKRVLVTPAFQQRSVAFDSAGKHVIDYDSILNIVQKSARIVFLACRSEIARKILIHAQAKNMTSSEYVYLFSQPYLMLPSYPDLTWLENSSEVSSTSSRSVLYLTYDNEGEAEHLPAETVRNIRTRISQSEANEISSLETMSGLAAPTLTAYTGVTLLAEVLNETIDPISCFASTPQLQDGKKLAEKFLNRTFSLPMGKVYISPGGQKYLNIVMKQMSTTSGKFESVVRYEYSTNAVTYPFNRKFMWSGGEIPLREPLCGFDNDKCQGVQSVPMFVTAPVIIVLILLVTSGGAFVKWQLRQKQSMELWWHLETTLSKHRNKRVDNVACATIAQRSRVSL
ncbi:hypothetical protein RvY_10979-1 [Ramazzottius varieornatus]|uniref:Receptor ligand binding region domain-containing protein n=1 Tax=Ramazzottius varieornatus TaxID=947166 RepID=A0A1D1VK13_RAMVA|nr:hypothetical protein RvY_10979-1 [Ramazzottius varieornatus]